MKSRILRVTAVLGMVMALATISAQAQSVVKKQRFVVPFQFTVGSKTLPAGEYTFTADNQAIRIQARNGKANAIALQQRTVGTVPVASESKLTFRRYGDQYYLSQVWLPDGVGREMKRQRPTNSSIARNLTTVELVSRPGN